MTTISKLCNAALCITVFTGPGGPAIADDQIFEISEVTSQGRVVTTHIADFDGDHRKDLMVVTLAGIPPAETRIINVHIQQPDGRFPEAPSHNIPVPRWSAVYDVADLRETPGEELVLLRPDGVTILSVGTRDATQWDLPVTGPSTVAASEDERGFDSHKMVYDEFGEGPWILVPQIGAVSVLAADGTPVARIRAGRRANYFVAKNSSLVSVESDIQLYLDIPKLSVGDVDGDGLADIVTSTRHEIRVFLRDGSGNFTEEPSYSLPLNFVSKRDHTRGSGSVVATALDIDSDDLLDLMVTHVEGTFSDTTTTTFVYRNRNGRWNISEPDDRFVSEGTLSSDLLLNVDRDDALELVRIQLKFSVLEVVELLLTREIDAQISIHRLQDDGHYSKKPWSRKKVSTGISFETFRPKGFMPAGKLDLNADGYMDFITSANGKGIEVYLGGSDGPFTKRSALQKLSTTGAIKFADFDNDGFADFVLHNPQEFDVPVKIGRNLGRLPRQAETDSKVTQ